MRRTALSSPTLMLIACGLLAACGHARVVRMGEPARAERHRADTAARAAPERIPRDGYHVVQSGETLYGISFRYGLDYRDVAAWNRLDDASRIYVGQRLRLLPPETIVARPPPPAAASAPIASAPQPAQPPSQSAPPSSQSAPPPSRAAASAPAASEPPPGHEFALATGGPAWRWPVSGEVIGRFVGGDPTKQGIDIAGSAGQPVLAAADGVVVYSGSGLVGYGELIIVKHSDQWLSAYAHNRRRLVAEGARVKAGDRIAELGSTGASRDMLHFEIRLNGKPVDPLRYLPPR